MAIAGTGAVAVAVLGTAVANAAMSSPTSYRLAQVTTGSPDPALTAVGTIQPIRQSTLSFPNAGRVATVAVRPGESVTGGQLLAALDTTALSAQLADAKSTVAAARARLSADQNAQTATTAATAGSTGGSGSSSRSVSNTTPVAASPAAASGTGAPPTASSPPSASAAASKVTALQKSVIADQHATDGALRQARTGLAEASTICRAGAVPAPQPSVDASATPSSTRTPSWPDPTARARTARPGPSTSAPSPSPAGPTASPVHSGNTGSPSPGMAGSSDCLAAESRALAWESTAYQDEQKVSNDEAALDQALTNASGRRTGTSTVPGRSASAGNPTTGAKARPVGAGSAQPSGMLSASSAARNAAPTAEQLAADQSAIDAATAEQQVAQQNLDQAKLFSPEAGTVRSVTLNVGDEVSAASTTEDIVISSPGGEQAVVNVPVSDIATVAQGQRATVTPDGSTTALTGTVTSIAVLPTGTTYPVTVTLDGGTTVPDGSQATVSLLAGNDRGTAMVVPTSAVISRGRGYAVQVDNHGTLTTIPVTIGASGPIYTEITGGLTAGQEVVIANVTAPLPTSNTGVRGFVGAGGPAAGTGRRPSGPTG